MEKILEATEESIDRQSLNSLILNSTPIAKASFGRNPVMRFVEERFSDIEDEEEDEEVSLIEDRDEDSFAGSDESE